MSCDSLTFGGNALQSLLARNVKDRCINSRLKGGRSSLVLCPRKLYGTSLKLKKKKLQRRRSKTVLGLRTSKTFELRPYGVLKTLPLAITSLTLMATLLLPAFPQSLKGPQIQMRIF